MHSFEIEVSDGPIELGRIASSGQMFRWIPNGDGWAIFDGDHCHLVRQTRTLLSVRSSQPETAFRRLLRLDENHAQKLEEIIRLGPELEPCLTHLTGMRMMRPACAHETLFSFLCSANNHISRITSMVWKLTQARSLPPAFSLESPHRIPFLSIDEIATLSEVELREQGFGYRAKSIPKVAQAVTEAFDDLKAAKYQDARAHLLTLPGVGPKLADCICLFAFDHQEAVPIDTHIWQQMTRIYYPDWQNSALTKAKYDYAAEAFRDRFGALAGVAHQFLFVENMTNYKQKTPKV